jgi:hypothetical protein
VEGASIVGGSFKKNARDSEEAFDTGARMAALLTLERRKAYERGKAECPNNHITVTPTIGDVEPGKTYCLLKTVPVEMNELKPAIGFWA